MSDAPSTTTASTASSFTPDERTASITCCGVATSTSASPGDVPHPGPAAVTASSTACA